VDCDQAVSLDARGLGWLKPDGDRAENIYKKRLNAVPYQNELWASRYPKLPGIVDDNAGTPKGNVLRFNVVCRSGPMAVHDAARKNGTVEDNLTVENLGFKDSESGDYSLPDDSPVLKRWPDFAQPFPNPGMYGPRSE
ncbi:MAG: hypothetical protein GY851_27245, partial [bacterium]|nr:hypothetical protein [bacterium]